MGDLAFTVFVVDDDPGVLSGLTRLLAAARYTARTFTSARDFLSAHDPDVAGCAILDVAMPELDGLELQRALGTAGIERPIIFLTGRGDIPMTVRAMQAGAIDFLTKPVSAEALLAAVARAHARDSESRRARSEVASIKSGLEKLTPREREVFTHVVAGLLNKQIASELGTVEKTVKVHRGRMMRKLGVRTVQDLVRLALRAGLSPQPATTPHRDG